MATGTVVVGMQHGSAMLALQCCTLLLFLYWLRRTVLASQLDPGVSHGSGGSKCTDGIYICCVAGQQMHCGACRD